MTVTGGPEGVCRPSSGRPRCSFEQAGEPGAGVAVTVTHCNLVKMHSTSRTTPAIKAGVVSRPWSVADLLAV